MSIWYRHKHFIQTQTKHFKIRNYTVYGNTVCKIIRSIFCKYFQILKDTVYTVRLIFFREYIVRTRKVGFLLIPKLYSPSYYGLLELFSGLSQFDA